MKSLSIGSVAIAMMVALVWSEEPKVFQLNGQAWMDLGRIMHVSDTLINGGSPDNVLNLNGNGIQSSGAQFTIQADLTENVEAAMGFGAYKATHALGSGQKPYLAISLYQNFMTQSRLTWYQGEKQNPRLSVTLGSFPFMYSSDVKNLGLYLFRGPVYPGILMGGFQDFSVDSTKSNMLGLRFHQTLGSFNHDLILNNEREIPPTMDWSLGYVAKYKMGEAVEFGAGVNFYRALAYKKALETPGKLSDAVLGFKKSNYIDVDTVTHDTTFFTHQGTKVMAMFSLDLSRLMNASWLRDGEMKLYGEAAIIGLKNYGKAYDDISKRIPVMMGFNFPAFGILDNLSVEVEYYGALYRNDLALVGNNNVVADWTRQNKPVPSPKPVNYSVYGIDAAGNWTAADGTLHNVKGTASDVENLTTDNFKWSLHAEKIVAHHIRFIGQVANDHYRPRPVATGLITADGGTAEAFTSPKDWYVMLRMGYFF